ncbi:MAG TPA: 2,3-epoxybenzoyl-CoA dihydrolase [Casimicrobiaceae bacterium]|nr:2,3-epoxybenzoyl-CoA dihydrolase [Casimicrobiaceae bacterium]
MNRGVTTETDAVDFRTDPARYRHWTLAVDDGVATLTLGVAEDGGIRPGYALKLNSYDLGVDIELADALDRIRFEHPEARAIVITGGRERVFCSGANIFMLGLASHAWKVNFCKFTNETRNGLEDASRHSGLKSLAAVNGACAGGGYELALACDEILLVDDRSSAVSLPEVPLLGVLPGTGGLTRVTDKRRVRHDHADILCTTAEGVRGQRALDWKLVDALAKPGQFRDAVAARARALADASDRPRGAKGVPLPPIARLVDAAGYHYDHVDVALDRARRSATFTLRGPAADAAVDVGAIEAAGAHWWPLAFARELDDAILSLRTNATGIGTWVLKTAGDPAAMLRIDAALAAHAGHWFVRETIGALRRTLARLDVTSRSLFALVEPGACCAGTLFEVALAADRSYMLAGGDDAPRIALSAQNFGAYPMVNGRARIAARFHDDVAAIGAARAAAGRRLDAAEAAALGLVTATPDDIDWADEVRIALEERASLSPDALTGLEANLRFGGTETMASRIFGRLTAWQNWIFVRPNAVGERGALKVYGKGVAPQFDWDRV